MPIYEFRCQECQKQFEVLTQSAGENKPVACPQCQSNKVQKSISATSYRVGGNQAGPPAGALSGCSSKRGFS